MAITITAEANAAGTTAPAPALPASPQDKDLHVLFVGCKPYNATINTPSGWTLITGTDGANGTVASGAASGGSGSVLWAAFYRYWVSGDAGPTINITSANTSFAVIHRFRPDAGSTINTPVGAKGQDTTSGTDYSATMGADPGITENDALVTHIIIPNSNAVGETPTLTATGATIGTVTESPASLGTTLGHDCAIASATATCTAGTSSAAAVVGWTLVSSADSTGGGCLVRIRQAVAATGRSNRMALLGVG